MRKIAMMRIEALAIAAAVLAGCARDGAEGPEKSEERRPLVKVVRVDPARRFRETRSVQASIRAKESALVSARVPGTIDALFADEGDTVEKGARLFQVDRVNLENAVRAAEDDLRLAKASEKEAKATMEKARLDGDRMKRLSEENAVTRDAAEKASVALARSEAACEAAAARITKAETALEIAKKNLADSTATAPFAGTVKRKLKEAGDYAGPGTPVFALDNPAVHEICFDLNAEDYARVAVGKTAVETCGRSLAVSYKSPSVNPATRTFEVRAVIDIDGSLAPGMLLDAEVVLGDRTGPALPVRAVNLRGGRETVFVVEDGAVKAVAVEAGLSRDGWREVRGVPEGAKVIAEGMLLVNEGDSVRIAGE
ncbi:MAG: efflux RND transporter periplasmic adaptor subunit [Kiritimatiellae bacterium]|nr:efflux RND transporter periplasmic adaptor subunit [Kiritimatiellia bacterium]